MKNPRNWTVQQFDSVKKTYSIYFTGTEKQCIKVMNKYASNYGCVMKLFDGEGKEHAEKKYYPSVICTFD